MESHGIWRTQKSSNPDWVRAFVTCSYFWSVNDGTKSAPLLQMCLVLVDWYWSGVSNKYVTGSSPPISGDYIISLGMQKAFESLLLKYKVDLAFWAHYHSYERTCPVRLGQCTPGAPVHIVVGTAGKSLDLEDYFPVSWSLYHENNYGYGRLTQANRSALHWEWVENTSGVVKDQVWLTK